MSAPLPRRTDVAVVGAGLAGLCAALHLTRAGLDVVVLEASDGVGGRVRTDVVDGLRLDRGFQVFTTSYPEAARLLDYEELNLRPFVPGALVRVGDALHRVADPRRQPSWLFASLRAPVGSLADKVRVGLLAAADGYLPVRRLLRREDRTTEQALADRGVSEQMVERFFRPFLSGVLLDRELETSSRFTDLVLRSFARGSSTVPAAGMQAIPDQLAARLPAGTIRLGRRASEVRPDAVHADGDRLAARAVVVAVDPTTTADLVGLPSPRTRAVTTWYHLADRSPHDVPAIVLDGDGGPVSNSVVLTDAAPSYASGGRVLVSSSAVGRSDLDERDVRRELARLHGVDTSRWQPVGRYEIDPALPAFPAGSPLRGQQLVHGVHVAGDARATPSIQGAMVSGTRAAEAVVDALRGTRRGQGHHDVSKPVAADW